MFWVIVLLLILGITLIFLEVFLPFGISLVCGLGLVVWSWYLCCQNTTDLPIALIWILFSGGLAVVTMWWVWRSGIKILTLEPFGGRDSAIERPVRGDIVQVLHPLRPTGAVQWKGRRFPARSIHAERELPKGCQVIIRSEDSIYFIVEPVKED